MNRPESLGSQMLNQNWKANRLNVPNMIVAVSVLIASISFSALMMVRVYNEFPRQQNDSALEQDRPPVSNP